MSNPSFEANTNNWNLNTPGATTVGSVNLISPAHSGVTLSSGDYIDYNAAMAAEGLTTTTYYDGNSPNWIWNGAVNNSTSTGPPL